MTQAPMTPITIAHFFPAISRFSLLLPFSSLLSIVGGTRGNAQKAAFPAIQAARKEHFLNFSLLGWKMAWSMVRSGLRPQPALDGSIPERAMPRNRLAIAPSRPLPAR